jgi:sulfate transport system permease protein
MGPAPDGHRGEPLMAAGASVATEVRPLTRGQRTARFAMLAVSFGFLGLLLLAPLGAVLVQALAKGLGEWAFSLKDPDTVASIKLTLLTAAIVVPVNTIFGICAAWAIARFEFRGKSLLVTLIDLPFAVSPVIAGLVLVFLFGTQGWFGQWLLDRDVQVIFAVPGIVLATIFISFPYVARELIPLMQQQGSDEEVAALSLGARPWTTFVRITLPKIRWGLLYGVILCNARVMGEFGAVSVVSGHIRGVTNTMPLQVEILYNEYNFVAAFAVASLLAMLAILTLVAKTLVEWRSGTGGH